MSVVVLDTNILVRLANPSAPEHVACRAAVTSLAETGAALAIVPQVLVEFWVVATRPAEVNGLGWTPALTHTAISGFLSQFQLLPETGHAFTCWLDLVSVNRIQGKRAHDARIAAVMLASGVTELLTLNTTDFDGIPGLVARSPLAVLR